jgi:hypothetical protein
MGLRGVAANQRIVIPSPIERCYRQTRNIGVHWKVVQENKRAKYDSIIIIYDKIYVGSRRRITVSLRIQLD